MATLWPGYRGSAMARSLFFALRARSAYTRLKLDARLAARGCEKVSRTLSREIDKIADLPSPPSGAMRLKLRARLALCHGALSLGVDALRKAVVEFERIGYRGEAATARLALGTVIGGDEGMALRTTADAFLAQEGIDGMRFSAIHYPEVFQAE